MTHANFLLTVLMLAAPVQPVTVSGDPDPKIERRSFQVAEGFEVNRPASVG
jgi:hypothetical protein